MSRVVTWEKIARVSLECHCTYRVHNTLPARHHSLANLFHMHRYRCFPLIPPWLTGDSDELEDRTNWFFASTRINSAVEVTLWQLGTLLIARLLGADRSTVKLEAVWTCLWLIMDMAELHLGTRRDHDTQEAPSIVLILLAISMFFTSWSLFMRALFNLLCMAGKYMLCCL